MSEVIFERAYIIEINELKFLVAKINENELLIKHNWLGELNLIGQAAALSSLQLKGFIYHSGESVFIDPLITLVVVELFNSGIYSMETIPDKVIGSFIDLKIETYHLLSSALRVVILPKEGNI